MSPSKLFPLDEKSHHTLSKRWPGLFGQDLPSFKWNVAPVYAATFCGSVFQ